MKPFSWQNIWIPELHPAEVVLRSAIVYIFVQIVFRLLGRKEWVRYSVVNMAILFLIAVSLRMTMVGNDQSMTSGLIAFGTICSLEWLLSWATYKSEKVSEWINGPVRHLIEDGKPIQANLREARISEEQLQSQVRLKGHRSIEEVESACLERSGKISIIWKNKSESIASKEQSHESRRVS